MRCKKRTCPACGVLWAGDQRTRLLCNLIDGFGQAVALLTITAPGKDVLPWVEGVCPREVAQPWNRAAPAQWSTLNRRTRRRLARSGLPAPRLLALVWAYQERGLLHIHAVFAAETELDRIANRAYVQALKRGGAREWGFGFVDLKESRIGSKGLAAYLAKYVCKEGADGRPELAHTVAHADVPARPVYISRQLTRGTRVTMRTLRLKRYFFVGCSGTAGEASIVCRFAEEWWLRGDTVVGRLGSRRIVRGPPRGGPRAGAQPAHRAGT